MSCCHQWQRGRLLMKLSLMPTWSWCHWRCHFDEDIEDPADDAEDPRDGLEAQVVVGEAHEVLESLIKTMMPRQRSWNPLLGWHDGTLMKPLYVLWWWWPYMVSGMWWMPLPWKIGLEGSWTYEDLRVCNILDHENLIVMESWVLEPHLISSRSCLLHRKNPLT